MSMCPRHQRPSALKSFLFGAPYYPEHWSADDRRDDAARMQAAGVNAVRMAEFAWDRIEPRDGEYDFTLFDDTIAGLGAHGINTILCTPTATPPRRLTEAHPEWLRVDEEGRRMEHGGRQHCCTTHAGFREAGRGITQAMAAHYADNPHVIGWQTDNEFYCHISRCFCPACLEGFQQWLRAKYGTVEVLNRAWGTAFWSQTYDTFEQVPPPYFNCRPCFPNPSHELDYVRFQSDAVIEFQRQQVDILRATNSQWFVTHNAISGAVDWWRASEDLDFVSTDIYPGFSPDHPVGAALGNEWYGSRMGSYLVLEQQAGAGGQKPYLHPAVAPGRTRLWAFQSIAHGADGILHFRWRTCRYGAEIYWNGILDHDNVPRRRYEEFMQAGRELQRIGARILGTVRDVRVAVLCEDEQEWAHAGMPNGLPSPRAQAAAALAELMRLHVPAGLVDVRDEFSGLDALILPSLPLIDDGLAGKLHAFVENGGTLAVTARSAVRDRNNHVLSTTPPGHMNELCGLTVEEFGSVAPDLLSCTMGKTKVNCEGAYEIFACTSATQLAAWGVPADGAPCAATGRTALAHNLHGKGQVFTFGTYLGDGNVHALLPLVTRAAAVQPLASCAREVEIACRRAPDRMLLFVLNHSGMTQIVTGVPHGLDLLTDAECKHSLNLDAYGVAIVECAHPADREMIHNES